MDENTLKLKLSVCNLTSQSLYHFKSKVLEYRDETTTTFSLSRYFWSSLYITVGITVGIKPVFNGDSGNVRLPPHFPLRLETDAFACTWINQKYRDPGLYAASACVSVLCVDVRGSWLSIGNKVNIEQQESDYGIKLFCKCVQFSPWAVLVY